MIDSKSTQRQLLRSQLEILSKPDKFSWMNQFWCRAKQSDIRSLFTLYIAIVLTCKWWNWEQYEKWLFRQTQKHVFFFKSKMVSYHTTVWILNKRSPSSKRRIRITKNLINAVALNRINTVLKFGNVSKDDRLWQWTAVCVHLVPLPLAAKEAWSLRNLYMAPYMAVAFTLPSFHFHVRLPRLLVYVPCFNVSM